MQDRTDQKAGPPHKSGVTSSAATRILTERLRELDINTSGLPPHVVAHLRTVVEDEAAAIQRLLVAEVAALQHKADERIRKAVSRAITFKSVGKAFGVAPATKADSSASTATGGAAK